MTKQPTKSSTPRLSEVARHVVVPGGVVSTGWPAVEKKCSELGIRFRWWQKPIGQIILSKRADGKYASTIGGTGLSIPRQVGKTFLVGAIVFALCLLRPNLTVIWTAHRVRTAEETFGKMQKFSRRKKIAPFIAKVVLGSGEEEIQFRNNSRILFGAREGGFGLGFDEVDVLIFDEAQRLKDATLDDMVPAANQSRQETSALLLFMGTPPRPTDSGEVFTRMRSEALSGEDTDTGWVEFGGDEGYKFTELPAPLSESDWKQIEKANPSYPDDTPREAILRMRKKLGPDSFRREGAGIWDEFIATERPISPKAWRDLEIPVDQVPTDPPARFALTMSPNRVASIGVAVPGEEAAYLDLAEMDRVDDSRLLVEWFVERRKVPVMIDSRDPAASLANELRSRGVKVNLTTERDMGRACGGLADAVREATIWHCGQPAVQSAIEAVGKRDIGHAGLWEFDLRDSSVDHAPLRAMTLAHFGLSLTKKRSGRGRSTTGRTAVSV